MIRWTLVTLGMQTIRAFSTRRWTLILLGLRAILAGGFLAAIWSGSRTALVIVLALQGLAIEYQAWMMRVLIADVIALQEQHHG